MYLARIDVVLTDTSRQTVTATGETEDEAALNLGNAATGINVAGIVHSTFIIEKLPDLEAKRPIKLYRGAWNRPEDER